MSFACHAPAGPLGEHVVDIWTCALPVGAVGPVERVLPSGTVELVINLRHDDVRVAARGEPARPGRYAGPVVSGTYAEPFVIDPRWHTEMLGVHFRPGGASRVLGVPAAELRGAHVELAALWGAAAAADLHERACAAREPGQRLAAVARVLHDRLARSRARQTPVPAALRLFGQSGTAAPVRDVAERVGLSHRRFIERFRSEVGLPPKLYCRILRFQRAVAIADRSASPDWATVALDCGYFDQSHLIRDFVAFAGLRPTEYLRARRDGSLRHHVAA